MATLTAVSTGYATHGEPMIPMYIFYSMFGFQRTGDGLWAIGDQMGRGFVLGATAGRTTLTGEGLQHADGHSHLLAATQPHIVAYDPAYGYEIAHIVKDGLRRMYGGSEECPHGENIMYYITLYNEPYQQPKQPDDLDVDGLLKGIYKLSPAAETDGKARAQLLASGVGVRWALEAQQLLAPGLGRRRRRLVGDQLVASSAGTPRRSSGPGCWIPDRTPATPYITQALGRRRRVR